VILKLTRDLGVNLAGVEIILNMREKMSEMQRQIEAFVSSLNAEMSQRVGPRTSSPPSNSLIPVIQVRRPKKAVNPFQGPALWPRRRTRCTGLNPPFRPT
jgi:MerR family transcriptional regulator/heat shock protein HspR